MSAHDVRSFVSFGVGDYVRAFDPRTLGVVKVGRVERVGRVWVQVDFGLTGSTRVTFADVLENLGRRP
jgi:hypothetical protein